MSVCLRAAAFSAARSFTETAEAPTYFNFFLPRQTLIWNKFLTFLDTYCFIAACIHMKINLESYLWQVLSESIHSGGILLLL